MSGCVAQLNLTDTRLLPALPRIKVLLEEFKARTGVGASSASGGKQWERLSAYITGRVAGNLLARRVGLPPLRGIAALRPRTMAASFAAIWCL